MKNVLAAVFHLDLQETICPGPAQIDGRHRDFLLTGSPDESISGPDHERTAHDQERVRGEHLFHCPRDSRLRDPFTKKDDIGLDDAAAFFTLHQLEGTEVDFQVDISIGGGPGKEIRPPWISSQQLPLKQIPTAPTTAVQTDNSVQSSVQIDDFPAPGGLVKSVHILCDRSVQPP